MQYYLPQIGVLEISFKFQELVKTFYAGQLALRFVHVLFFQVDNDAVKRIDHP